MSATVANQAEFQNAGKPVASPIYQVDSNGNPINQPTQNAAVAAGGSTAAVVVKATAGFLSGVLVTANASAVLTIYDNASAASGTVIGVIPATATAGQYYPLNMPAKVGITAGQVNGSPAVTVAYS
ncbi:MAG: hypothetical protein H0W02_10125 [Ktedonobacteraceae bacterium]|nr:hypothetical protein [Ktedonobacteraceae bacterium]